MGLRLFKVSNSSREQSVPCGNNRLQPTDPNPQKFEITKYWCMGEFVVLMVNYPNCTNYEGNKILVFKNIKLSTIRSWSSLDPHFLDDGQSPIARFKPDGEGWELAKRFVQFS